MSLTREQVERWLATLAPGSGELEQVVAAMNPLHPFYPYLLKVSEGTKDGIAILTVIAGRLRIAELQAEGVAVQQAVDAAMVRVTP